VIQATISHGQAAHRIELTPEQARSGARPVEAAADTDA
jgi:hypothetical protein